MGDYIPLIKVQISDKKILDELSKLRFFVYKDKSRIDGYPMYEIDMTMFRRYIKIKKIKGEDVTDYDRVLSSMKIVSVLEDYLPHYIKIHNPTSCIILSPTVI